MTTKIKSIIYLPQKIILLLFLIFSLQPSFASDALMLQAAKCATFESCLDIMLKATDPRSPETISIAAARIGELQKPIIGNRKIARDINTKGLIEFKKNNFSDSIKLFQQAANENPSDVEIQSNLALALLRDKRPEEAKVALRSALILNPRRTSSWIPMAEYFLEIGDSNNAVASLFLGYEFSENKPRTRIYFEEKAGSIDKNSTSYTLVLKKLGESSHLESSATPIDQEKSNKSRMITKGEATAMLTKSANEAAVLRNNDSGDMLSYCLLVDSLDSVFADETSLENSIFEKRMLAAKNRIISGMRSGDQNIKLKMYECTFKSLDKLLKKNEVQSANSPAALMTPLLDMDDLRLDIATSLGKKVRVKGVGSLVMDMFMLKKNMTDMNPVLIDISKIPREQRRQIIQKCSDITFGCRVNIFGTVGPVNYSYGILAESIEW